MPQVLVQVKWIEQQKGGVIAFFPKDFGRCLALGAVGPGKVKPELIDAYLGEKLLAIPEGFQVEQFRLNQTVAGFHVGVGVGRGWRRTRPPVATSSSRSSKAPCTSGLQRKDL